MVERGALEMRCPLAGTGGSNPSLSANLNSGGTNDGGRGRWMRTGGSTNKAAQQPVGDAAPKAQVNPSLSANIYRR